MSDFEAIFETIANEGLAAVKAASKDHAARVDAVNITRESARSARHDGMCKVRQLREQAAELLAESLRLEEQVEAKHREAEAEIDGLLSDMRGPRLGNGRKLKVIA